MSSAATADMLGSQTWFLALGIPTVAVGGFIASRKRLAYQWREELMDMEGGPYSKLSDGQMELFRRVAPADNADSVNTTSSHSAVPSGYTLRASENIGLAVERSPVSQEAAVAILTEIRSWSEQIGNPVDRRKVVAFARRLEEESQLLDSPPIMKTVTPSFYERLRLIADHAEDCQLMRAPWGSGDRMRHEEMPSALRFLVKQTQDTWEGIGRLRHVYIEYSPTGEFYREPKSPKHYDGHDYVIIPVRRDRRPTVVTMSPTLRSRVAYLREVMQHSWTSRDVDALLPFGEMLRVYGTARYDWGWGIRPGPTWFGSCTNTVDRLPVMTRGAGETTSERSAASTTRFVWSSPTSWLAAWHGGNKRRGDHETFAGEDAALIVLHFEGPRAKGKQRSLLFQPERWIFGRPPTAESYEAWVEDRPTAESVREEGVLRFIIRNYFTMLTVS